MALFMELANKKDRIMYAKSSTRFRKEDLDMYEHFLKRYDLHRSDVILHDCGGAFKHKTASTKDSPGFTKHLTYPTKVF